MNQAIINRGDKTPGFYLIRVGWVNPSRVIGAINLLKEKYPQRDYEVADTYTFFRLLKESEAAKTVTP